MGLRYCRVVTSRGNVSLEPRIRGKRLVRWSLVNLFPDESPDPTPFVSTRV